jgi:hypothetical protein
MSRSLFAIVAVLILIFSRVEPTEAALIIGNGNRDNAAGTGGNNFVSHGGYGQQFRMGGEGHALKSVQVMMRTSKNSQQLSGAFRARVYSIASLATLTPLISSTFTAQFDTPDEGKWFDVDFLNGLSLTGGADYVFAIEKVTSGQLPGISWQVPTNAADYASELGASAPTSAGGFHWQKNNGSSNYALTSSATNFGFRIETEAVPEPSTWMLIGMAFVSLATVLRRAFNKRAAKLPAVASIA